MSNYLKIFEVKYPIFIPQKHIMKINVLTIGLFFMTLVTYSQNMDSLKKEKKLNSNFEISSELSIQESRYNLDSAKFYLEKAEKLFEQDSKNANDSGLLNFARSTYWNAMGNELFARKYIIESIKNYSQCKNELWLSKALLKLINYNVSGLKFDNFDSLETQFNNHVVKSQHQKQFLILQKNILKTHYYNYYGYYDLSAKLAFEGLAESQSISDKYLEMKAYEALGSLFQMTNEIPKAIKYIQLCKELTKSQAPIELYMRYTNIAVCELQRNNQELAKKYLDSASIFVKYSKQLSFICLMKGQFFAQEGNMDSAKKSVDAARKLYFESNNLARIADCEFFIGDILVEENNLKEAEKYYKSYVQFHEMENNPEQKFGGYQALSQLYSNLKNYKLAFEYANKCVYIQDTLNAIKKLKEIKSQEIKYETTLKQTKIDEQKTQLDLSKKKQSIILLSSLIALGSLIAFFLILRNRQKQKLLQIQKEKLSYQLESIRGKIVPHFSGNVLNAITYFFETNQNDQAIYYLSKYTELNKEILLCTEFPSRTLNEEVKFINNYIELEKLRYQEKLQFKINIEKDVDLQTQVPVLILHTFCENAIKHGIMSKKGKGELSLTISNLNSALVSIVIQDDGIGRAEASQLNDLSTKQGLKILFKQIDAYNENNKNKISIQFDDILVESKIAGTKVSISIPKEFNFNS